MNRPLVPDDMNIASAVPRAAYAMTMAKKSGVPAAKVCAKSFPGDQVALAVLQRASIGGGTTTGAGWAADLSGTAVSAWLGSLSPLSAAAELIRRGLVAPIGAHVTINIPDRSGAPAPLSWVGEGAPIPARQYTVGNASLSPRKLACLVSWSRELQKFSQAEEIFTGLLNEDAAASLDVAVLSNQAGDTIIHRGLLAGVSATPESGRTDNTNMLADLSALAQAVAPAGDGLVFIASPGRCATVRMRSTVSVTILPSLAVPTDELVAIDAGALVSGIVPEVDIASSTETTFHSSDTPADLGVVGSPAVVAAPSISVFQTGAIVTRLILELCFAVRRPGSVAYMTGINQW